MRCADGCGGGAVYINGQVLGGTGFPNGNRGLHCEWELVTGTNWRATQGLTKVNSLRILSCRQTFLGVRSRSSARSRKACRDGATIAILEADYRNALAAQGHTQLDFPVDPEEAVWAHPVEVHYAVEDRVQGWPKFQVQVFQEDQYGRDELVGYGFVHIPSAPGLHEVQCSCWRPMSPDWNHEVQAFFVGGNPQLKSPDLIAENIDRYKLRTRSSGRVNFKLQVMLKGFSKYGFQFSKADGGV